MSCQKIPYSSKGGAKAAAKRANATHGGRAMEAFRCEPGCGMWHVGHQRRGRVVNCFTCGRRLTLEGARDGVLLPTDDAGRQHDSRLCSRVVA